MTQAIDDPPTMSSIPTSQVAPTPPVPVENPRPVYQPPVDFDNDFIDENARTAYDESLPPTRPQLTRVVIPDTYPVLPSTRVVSRSDAAYEEYFFPEANGSAMEDLD